MESESKKGSKTKKPAEESTDGESDTNVLKKRQMIYKELLATEKVYVEDLKTVLHVNTIDWKIFGVKKFRRSF